MKRSKKQTKDIGKVLQGAKGTVIVEPKVISETALVAHDAEKHIEAIESATKGLLSIRKRKPEIAIRLEKLNVRCREAGIPQYDLFRAICPELPETLSDKQRKANHLFNALANLCTFGRRTLADRKQKAEDKKNGVKPMTPEKKKEVREALKTKKQDDIVTGFLSVAANPTPETILSFATKVCKYQWPASQRKPNGDLMLSETGTEVLGRIKSGLAESVAAKPKQTTKRTA